MSKPLIIGIVVVAALAIGAYFLFGTSQNTQEDTVSGNVADRMSESAAFAGLDTARPIVCDYTDESTQTTAYISNNKVRVDGTTNEEVTSAIIDGDTIYFWNRNTGEGYTMTFTEDMQQVPEEAPDTPFSQEEVTAELEQQQADCRNENFDTTLLTPPADIQFQDFTQMMQEQMEQVQEDIPQDVQEQIPEEYQQYLPE